MQYIILSARWCNTTDLKVYVENDDKSDYSNESIYDEPGSIFEKFPQYYIKVFRRFQYQSNRWSYFKTKIEKNNLEETSNGNGVIVWERDH
jgi:hypothetical protein